MKRITCITLGLLMIQINLFGQDLWELDSRNGFKDLKLGSNVEQYEGVVLVGPAEDESVPEGKRYTAKSGYYQDIGGIKITGLDVNVYRSQIYSISVKTVKDPNLLKALRKAFGKPAQILGNSSYEWKTDKLILFFRSYSKQEIELFYNSFDMRKKMKEDKDKKVQEIADDF
ncbi:MAG: hypothetical protein O7F74_00940 [Bacteroidetes bacterium]|nr:hypothetical protein [Bacteroidota bacterium]